MKVEKKNRKVKIIANKTATQVDKLKVEFENIKISKA